MDQSAPKPGFTKPIGGFIVVLFTALVIGGWLYVDGVNFRRIARTLGVNHQSVINWVNAHATQLPAEPPLPAGKPAVAELDELFTFVGSKKTSSTS